MLCGFAAGPDGHHARTPIFYASLFAATQRVCVLAPYMDRDFANALAIASTFVPVRVAVASVADPGLDIQELIAEFPHVEIRIPQTGNIHAKQIVLDGTLGIFGSAKLTSSGWKYPFEKLFGSTDPVLVGRLQRQFDICWESIARSSS